MGLMEQTAFILFVVSGSPVFTFLPEDVEYREGQSAVIHCAANGYPLPSISWTRQGENVVENIRFRVLSTGSLHITNVRFSDTGEYRCDAANSVDSLSASADLTVIGNNKLVIFQQ